MGINSTNGAKSIEKLSSGYRINRAGDDAAGLAISEKMRGQIRGLNQASRNSQDGISLIQTAEGALNETQAILQRMRELAVQSANDTNVNADRTAIQNEVDQLTTEIDRIANTTEFNTRTLLNGDLSAASTSQATVITAQSGLDSDAVGTAAAGATLLTNLHDSNGNSLGLQSGDTISIETTINGTLQTATLTVGAATDIDDLDAAVEALGGVSAFAIDASGVVSVTGNAGVANAITSFSISAVDGSGNQRTSFNSFMANAQETQTAQDNTGDGTISFHIGSNQGQTLDVSVNNMTANSLGIGSVNITTQVSAENAITVVNNAITKVSDERAKLGAVQNRLEHTIKNLDTSSENLQASESRIRDVDMAKEMMNFTKNNILQQAAQAMLAQANQQPQGVLQLLR